MKKLLEFFERIRILLIKLISVKGLILGLSFYLCYDGKLDGFWFAIFALLIIGIRTLEKVSPLFPGIKGE